jgi:hypothetical protein
MRRWLLADGHEVVVVAAGHGTATGGDVIDIVDPAGLAGDVRALQPRGPLVGVRRLWRELQHLPDAGIAWARAVARDRRVLKAAKASDCILSSSPPESTHLAAMAISKATGVAHLCDLQDGWIDEPLRPTLQRFAFRRWQEARLEARVFHHSRLLLVTSSVWEKRLHQRYPDLRQRVRMLPLGVAVEAPSALAAPVPAPRGTGTMRLLHAGSFTMSHNARRMEYLLEPLLQAPEGHTRIELLGRLHPRETAALESWRGRFEAIGWELAERDAMPRDEFLRELPGYDGLLLLSASFGAVPSKLYEYLQTGLPILAVCPHDSAVAEIARRHPAMELVEMAKPSGARDAVTLFVQCCREGRRYAAAQEFSDESLAAQFLEWIKPLFGTDS